MTQTPREAIEKTAMDAAVDAAYACTLTIGERARDAVAAYLSALAAAGYVVRPMEPTVSMLIGARDWSAAKYGKPIGADAAIGCWQAMIGAEAEAKGGTNAA